MDLLKTLRSLEEVLYELALWMFLIPKTLVKVIVNPKWVLGYVARELEKEDKDRWDGYMSPIAFWAIAAVLPYVVSVQVFKLWLGTPEIEIMKYFVSLPFEKQFLSIAIFLLSFPLGYSVVILKLKRQALGRESLKRMFYTQCLFLTSIFRYGDGTSGGI